MLGWALFTAAGAFADLGIRHVASRALDGRDRKLAGGRILTAVQENGNMVLGIPMYGQQLLSAISFLFAVAALLFIRLALEKQKTIAK
jgi:hypothetical protein